MGHNPSRIDHFLAVFHILGPENESERELGMSIRAKPVGGSTDSGWTKAFLIWFMVVSDSLDYYKLSTHVSFKG